MQNLLGTLLAPGTAGDGVPYGEILPKRVGNGYDRSAVQSGTTTAPTAKRDQLSPPLRHCEAEGRGNLQHRVSIPIAPINIGYPKFSMLTYLSVYPTAAVEIATA